MKLFILIFLVSCMFEQGNKSLRQKVFSKHNHLSLNDYANKEFPSCEEAWKEDRSIKCIEKIDKNLKKINLKVTRSDSGSELHHIQGENFDYLIEVFYLYSTSKLFEKLNIIKFVQGKNIKNVLNDKLFIDKSLLTLITSKQIVLIFSKDNESLKVYPLLNKEKLKGQVMTYLLNKKTMTFSISNQQKVSKVDYKLLNTNGYNFSDGENISSERLNESIREKNKDTKLIEKIKFEGNLRE